MCEILGNMNSITVFLKIEGNNLFKKDIQQNHTGFCNWEIGYRFMLIICQIAIYNTY